MSDGAHPDLDILADLQAGVLARQQATELEQHLDQCAYCSSRADSLVEVRSVLRTVGAERPTMPPEIATRLTTALRDQRHEQQNAEAVGGDAEASASDPPDLREHAGRSQRRRGSGRFARGVAVAAGLAVLAVGGTATYQAYLAESAEDQPPTTAESTKNPDNGDAETPKSYALGNNRALQLTEQDFDTKVSDALVPRSKAEDSGPAPDSTESPDAPGGRPRQDEDPSPNGSLPDEGSDQGSAADRSTRCVRDALAGSERADGANRQLLDTEPAHFDGEPAVLAISRGSSADTVHAWVIAGCPDDGSVAHDDEITVGR